MNDLTPSDKQTLIDLARTALAAALANKQYAPETQNSPALQEKCGCFVTLKTNNSLRGCIGCFTSEEPIWRTVPTYARHSALDDPRFIHNRLSSADLPNIQIEISVLSPLQPCREPRSIILGKHGIYVQASGRSGCFLPQVATETNWTIEEFWGHCCQDKAGLAYSAWTQPGTALFTFTADVFGV